MGNIEGDFEKGEADGSIDAGGDCQCRPAKSGSFHMKSAKTNAASAVSPLSARSYPFASSQTIEPPARSRCDPDIEC
jgi:hypothetical protein